MDKGVDLRGIRLLFVYSSKYVTQFVYAARRINPVEEIKLFQFSIFLSRIFENYYLSYNDE